MQTCISKKKVVLFHYFAASGDCKYYMLYMKVIWDIYHEMIFFLCSDSLMEFFRCFRTESASSCIGPTRSYRSCNIQVEYSVCTLLGFFVFLLLLFPFMFRSNMLLLDSLALLMNAVHQWYLFKRILIPDKNLS